MKNVKCFCSFFLFAILFLLQAKAQVPNRVPSFADSLFSDYYHQRLMHFKTLPQTPGDIIFLGNSITDGAEWSELFNDIRIKNRGISGDVTTGVMHRLEEITLRKPSKVFLMIGVNDLARGVSVDSVAKNIFSITAYIKQNSPATKLYVQSLLPVNGFFKKFSNHVNKSQPIKALNTQLQKAAAVYNYTFIDVHAPLANAQGNMNAGFTNDGLHLNGEAYLLWKHLLYAYVYDVQFKPALIPMPQKLQWQQGYFKLHSATTIVIRDSALQNVAIQLKEQLQKKGLHLNISSAAPDAPYIELNLREMNVPRGSSEAYQLHAGSEKIAIAAATPHGIFNGMQTLMQLARDGVLVDACIITDYPAFSWRAYMVDVGRNYQSMDLLKEQIDVMAKYKLNVFHFHATEDIAWRLAIPGYPQLNAPGTMLRNSGAYYSVEELKNLIQYCKDRHITFIPEIDMPGHSAAFARAMGVEMQSDEGLKIVKDILKKFCETYDVEYVHIGGDEVKITKKNFLPEVTALLHRMGKKTIGWEPGGNFSDSTIRQLWMEDVSKSAASSNIQFIDSRHLYINHMDPLESVVTIFNRRMGNKDSETPSMLGATLCLWHDRRVENERDVLLMNPVYPSILTFAERTWQGGGTSGWVANIGAPQSPEMLAFKAYENRLMEHKTLYFFESPFPYRQQSDIVWKFYGPYPNGGNLLQAFAPEREVFNERRTHATMQAVGGTIVLRHWWAPLIEGLIKDPKENNTWYATTKIWSDVDTLAPFWVGFNNISRSPATDAPECNTWDNRGSNVLVNGIKIKPPQWKRCGQKGHAEIPLTDEGYEYREPTLIAFHKGWNRVLVKLPVGSFKGKDWHNPVKWMFTFVAAGQ